MARISICVIFFVMLAIAGCGKNNGTPMPQQSEQISDNLLLAPRDGQSLQVSNQKNWRAEVRWGGVPRFSDEELLALNGVVFIRKLSGLSPEHVRGVEFIADMPQHGHGTGNNIPVVHPTADDAGRYTFGNVIFTMQGQWRIRVLATVDGVQDVWTTWVDVK